MMFVSENLVLDQLHIPLIYLFVFMFVLGVILTGENILITLSGEMVNIVIINSVSITHERQRVKSVLSLVCDDS